MFSVHSLNDSASAHTRKESCAFRALGREIQACHIQPRPKSGGGVCSSGGQALRSPEVSHRGGLLLGCLSNEKQGRSQVPENGEFLRVNKGVFQ